MKLEIYQTDKKDFVFFSFERNAKVYQICDALDLRKFGYRRVYCNNGINKESSERELLEKIYILMNRDDRPYAQKMRSLSVSDIVILDGRAYYCDSMGFKRINAVDTRAKARDAVMQLDK